MFVFFFLLKELALVFGTSSKPSYSKFATWFPLPHFCMPTKRHLGPIYRSDLGWAATKEGVWGCLQHMGLLESIKTVSQGRLRLVPGVWVTQTSSQPFALSWFPSLEVVVMPSNIFSSEGEKLFFLTFWYTNEISRDMVRRSLVILYSFWICIACAE